MSHGSAPGQPVVEVRRSKRRKRTVSAVERDGVIVVMIPDRATKAQEARYVSDLVAKLQRKAHLRSSTEADLLERARDLNARHLEGLAVPEEVVWVTNMTQRWASCTPAAKKIRMSHRLQSMPKWVLDYVLVHELAHLLHANHGREFWSLVDRYPRAAEAKAYLSGVAHGANLKIGEDDLQPE